MNLYFVVEGAAEGSLYPAWLGHLLPELQQITNSNRAIRNNYYLISGGGYPAIYDMIKVAMEEIYLTNNYNYPSRIPRNFTSRKPS